MSNSAGATPSDDLEDRYELVLRAKKADLVELVSVIHEGGKAKTHAGEMVPPDAEMVHELCEDMAEELQFNEATDDMRARLEQGGTPVVGESIDVELRESEEYE